MKHQDFFITESGVSPIVLEKNKGFLSVTYEETSLFDAMDIVKHYFNNILGFDIKNSKIIFLKKGVIGFIIESKIDTKINNKTKNTLAFTVSIDGQICCIRIKLSVTIVSFYQKGNLLGETMLPDWLLAKKNQKRVNDFKTEGHELIFINKDINLVEKLLITQ